MKLPLAMAAVVLAALGCGGGAEPKPEPKAPSKPAAKPEPKAEPRPDLMPAKLADPEPEHILVAHVLVSFAGAPRSKATRSKEAAEKLAYEVLVRARKGEDFNKLIKDISDDSGEGVYGLANHRISPVGDEYERRKMVPAFGDVGFKLEVGSIGMSTHDSQKSPFGWHIIKRLK
jgi:parvulin-like peptidyl-prolyl cis-trans isomerase-like protein